MQPAPVPILRDLVLVGGGHSHAIVLRKFGMDPLPGVRLTLISDASDTPYSGMVPGHVAGFYRRDECYIDLRSLARFAGAQFYVDRAVGLDLAENRVLCANRPPVAFDLLSLDIGSTPQVDAAVDPAVADRCLPAKPIRPFLDRWRHRIVPSAEEMVAAVAGEAGKSEPLRVAIVGGGVGGVELAFTMQRRLQAAAGGDANRLQDVPPAVAIALVHKDGDLLPGHNRWVRRRAERELRDRGIALHLHERATGLQSAPPAETGTGAHPARLVCASGLVLPCDWAVWVTQASAPDWLAKSGLATDDRGFVAVNEALQSVSHPQVFAAGDVAAMLRHPRPKAGVFAVRQGQPLFDNLRRSLQGQPLRPYRPQGNYLNLIGTADGSAIASRGWFGWASPLLWRWKDWIDRRFMEKFSDLPAMAGKSSPSFPQPPAFPDAPAPAGPKMYCAGCGSKVGGATLDRVLARILRELGPATRADVLAGLDAPDDGSVVTVPEGFALVQTADAFRAIVDDPYQFGQIAAHHALSDLYAMGAQPQSALAIATVPYGGPGPQAETLYQLLSGAIAVLDSAGAVLAGGHTTEGPELFFGLSCNGLVPHHRWWRKGGLQPGDALVLTQPLGTGTLFAALAEGRAKGRWIDGAIAAMLQSNGPAAEVLARFGPTACTDVTGFGLAGHLLEMVRASPGVGVVLDWAAVPALPGAIATLGAGIASSLQPQNLAASAAIALEGIATDAPEFQLLFDPQTAGGLLAGIPGDRAEACLAALGEAGCHRAAIVGWVEPAILLRRRCANAGQLPIHLAGSRP